MYRAEMSVNAPAQTTAKSHSFPWGNISVLVNHSLTGELPQGKGKQADFVFCDPNPRLHIDFHQSRNSDGKTAKELGDLFWLCVFIYLLTEVSVPPGSTSV